MAEFLRDTHYQPEQVQDFYPTPGTLSTAMYYTGLNPMDMKPVYIPKDRHEKAMQRALLQFSNPKNYDLVHEALVKAHREDLIGYGRNCLIKPRKGDWSYEERGNSGGKGKNSKGGKSSSRGKVSNSKGKSNRGRDNTNRKSSGNSKARKKRR